MEAKAPGQIPGLFAISFQPPLTRQSRDLVAMTLA